MGKRHRDDSVSSSAEEEGDADDDRHHRHKSSSRHHKKHSRKKESSSSSRKHKKKRKSRDYDKDERSSMSYSHSYSDDTSAPSFSSEDDNDRRRRRDKKKKESKKDKKRRKHHKKDKKKKDKKRSRHNSTEKTEEEPVTLERQDHVAQALTELFTFKPIMASELPIMLIRLAGGASFDLRQMTDAIAAQGLEKVLTTLQSFGVQKHPETKMWYFQPPASAPGKNRDELVLLRVIRALLNDAGVTMEDIEQFEAEEEAKQKEVSEKALQEQEQAAKKESGTTLEPELAKEVELVKDKTQGMLLEFSKKDPQLGQQLGELCKTIVEGESISIDGIPDESLKVALESIFVACGLEKSEIIDDDEDEDGDSDDAESRSGPVLGYGLPDDENNSSAQIKLAGIMEACRTAASDGGAKKRVLGPARGPLTQAQMEASNLYPEVESEDDEGPAPIGAARRRGPAPSEDDVAAEARYRELQLKATAQGVDMPTADGAREEWMLLPGEHDFLSSIVSGQTIKSRGFQNKKARGADDKEQQPIHPAVQAEMDAIMQAHADLRGPSLIEQHREKVRKDKEEKAKQKGKQWTWNRESDLDAGRRVDKDALHQVLGGAAENLKSKFQGGFH